MYDLTCSLVSQELLVHHARCKAESSVPSHRSRFFSVLKKKVIPVGHLKYVQNVNYSNAIYLFHNLRKIWKRG